MYGVSLVGAWVMSQNAPLFVVAACPETPQRKAGLVTRYGPALPLIFAPSKQMQNFTERYSNERDDLQSHELHANRTYRRILGKNRS